MLYAGPSVGPSACEPITSGLHYISNSLCYTFIWNTSPVYELRIRKQAIKALQAMPRREAERIPSKLRLVADDPNRRDVDIARLQGRTGFRLRVGDVRIIIERDHEAAVFVVLRIASRGQVYSK